MKFEGVQLRICFSRQKMIWFSANMRNGFLIATGVSFAALTLWALVLLPTVIAIFATLVLCAQLILLWVCNAYALRGIEAPKVALRVGTDTGGSPFLSVHLPAHDEPPSVYIATLESLQLQVSAPPHEIGVMMNKTADAALWKPVEAWCAEAARPFCFLRQDGVISAKAGALNIALLACNPATTHIVFIDADYCVFPEFLRIVADQITGTRAGFIQFPQAYRHLTPATEGLSVELADYFNRHARAANMAQAMLPTDTLSVISRKALVDVGGWPLQSGTEDAAPGSNLIAKGYSGVCIDRIVGPGLLPIDLAGLHQQRHRWAAGNAQVLLDTLRRWFKPGAPVSTWMHKALVAAQLAAWLNLGAMAAVTLCVALLQLAAGLTVQGEFASVSTITASLLTFILILCGAVYPLVWSKGSQVRPAVRWQAVVSRVSMLPVAAWATLSGALTRQQSFRVTPKHINALPDAGPLTALNISGVGAIAMIGAGTVLQDSLAVIAGLLLLMPLICAMAARRALSAYSADVASQES